MKKILTAFLRAFTFQRQLSITVTVGILCLALFSSLVSSWQGNERVRRNLLDQGQRITENLARQSTLALLYASPDNAAEAVNATLAFPGVVRVEIRDTDQRVLLVRGSARPAGFPENFAPAIGPETSAVLDAEREGAWRFVAPVYSAPGAETPFEVQETRRKRLGDVAVMMSKAALAQMTADIFVANMTSSFTIALLILILIRFLTRRMTLPLNLLSAAMARAMAGGSPVRAELSGPKDIVDMAHAFNGMMTALDDREAELRQAKAALEAAQEAAHIGDLVLGPHETLLRCSDEAARILGRPRIASAEELFSVFRDTDCGVLRSVLSEAAAFPERRTLDCNIRVPAGGRDLQMVVTRQERDGRTLVTVQDVTEIRQAERSLRDMAAKADALRERERARVAHELHDELGQVLTAIRMHASLPDGTGKAAVHALADRAIGYVRNLASTLRPAALDLGLTRGIEWLCQEMQTNFGIECTLESDPVDLPEEKAIQVFRIVQECLTNTAKHAQARTAGVDLVVEGDRLILHIQDDGVGFDPRQRKGHAMGLLGLRERVQRLRGVYRLVTAPGQGTKHYVAIPLKDRRCGNRLRGEEEGHGAADTNHTC